MRFRCIFLGSLLTKNSPCFPMKGILNQILGLVSPEKSFWDGISLMLCLLQSALDLTSYLAFSLRIIENRTLAGNPFQDINLAIIVICLFKKVKLLHIFTARGKSDLTHAVLRDQGSKLSKRVYWPVCVDFRKILMPESEISKSKKWILPFSKLSTVNYRFLSKLLNLFKTKGMSLGLIKTRVSST